MDPLTREYPWYTPYQFAGNKPIWAIDVDGLEELIYQYTLDNRNVSLIRKIDNGELQMQGVGERQKPLIIDKRTGRPMSRSELGMVQYQYFSKDGTRLNVRRDYNGQYVAGENEMMPAGTNNYDNTIYISKDNPTYIDQNGVERPDYRREPTDLADKKGMDHDMAYDGVNASGINGAMFDKKTVPADAGLIRGSIDVINQAKAGKIDPYTGKPISQQTVNRANFVAKLFVWIIGNKTTPAGGAPQTVPKK